MECIRSSIYINQFHFVNNILISLTTLTLLCLCYFIYLSFIYFHFLCYSFFSKFKDKGGILLQYVKYGVTIPLYSRVLTALKKPQNGIKEKRIHFQGIHMFTFSETKK